MDTANEPSVLLVDDNPANLVVMETVLEELGLNLVKANSGKEALRRLLEQDFAVIALDVNMPDMSGFEAARLIRRRPRSQHTPILFVTAVSQSDASALQGYALGAVDYICTPVAPEVIRAKIRVFVDLYRLNRELNASVEALDRDVSERRRAEAALRESESRLQVLHEIDRAILAAQSPGEIARVAVGHIRRAILCERASVLQFDRDGRNACILAIDSTSGTRLGAGQVMRLGSYRVPPAWTRGEIGVQPDLKQVANPSEWERLLLAEGLRAYTAIPLMAGEQLIGTLDIARSETGVFPKTSVDFARQVADSLAVAIQNARLHEQVELSRSRLQTLSRRLVEVQEDERRAIARELHDEASQALTSLVLGLALLERENGIPDTACERVHALKQITDGVMEGLHRLAADLRPASLDKLGLVPALRQYLDGMQKESGVRIELTAAGFGDDRLPLQVEITLYRLIQEALANVLRHAQASSVEVVVNRQGTTIDLLIADDGQGFDVEAAMQSGRLGLLGMRERAEMLGGTFDIESSVGQGTSIMAQVPCEPPVRDGNG